MPYIEQELRPRYDFILDKMPSIGSKGALEYCVYKLMQRYMKDREFRYSNLHDCVYAVAHSAHEYERNYLDKREDEAKQKNGDIQ